MNPVLYFSLYAVSLASSPVGGAAFKLQAFKQFTFTPYFLLDFHITSQQHLQGGSRDDHFLQTEIPQQILEGLPWTFSQTFMAIKDRSQLKSMIVRLFLSHHQQVQFFHISSEISPIIDGKLMVKILCRHSCFPVDVTFGDHPDFSSSATENLTFHFFRTFLPLNSVQTLRVIPHRHHQVDRLDCLSLFLAKFTMN